jgi:hypothetical protein
VQEKGGWGEVVDVFRSWMKVFRCRFQRFSSEKNLKNEFLILDEFLGV